MQRKPHLYKEKFSSKTVPKESLLYITIWRWHFYAGIIFAPIIIMLAISGGAYLFKPQIESSIYHDLYYIQEKEQKITSSEQIDGVKDRFPEARITSFKPSYESGRTSQVSIVRNGDSISAFIDPYNGNIVGTIDEKERLMASILGVHNGMLWGGEIGNIFIELVACWGIILVITGIYLWWPRKRKSRLGTLIPRLRLSKLKRLFWRDVHAVTAFWFSLFIVIQLFSGLMWTDVWGGMANQIVNKAGIGSPVGDQPWEKDAFPKSSVPTKQVADVPWAAENLPVPVSAPNQSPSISVEHAMAIAEDKNVHPGYVIAFPEDERGVYTVYLDPAEVYPNRPIPQKQQTLHVDQYSGEVLADFGWSDYGFMGKIISLGIAFHQGEFGLFNQLFNLILVIALIIIPVSGLIMWWKRKPEGMLGAPTLPTNFKMVKGLTLIVIALGIFFPLVGVSLLFVWVLDWLIFSRIKMI